MIRIIVISAMLLFSSMSYAHCPWGHNPPGECD